MAAAPPPAGEHRLPLPDTPEAPAIARRFVAQRLAHWSAHDLADVELAVSEVVTNALRHADGPHWIAVETNGDGWARIDVADGTTDLPVARTPTLDDASGRGLLMVGRLTTQWGVAREGDGKVVWLEVEAERVRPVAAGATSPG